MGRRPTADGKQNGNVPPEVPDAASRSTVLNIAGAFVFCCRSIERCARSNSYDGGFLAAGTVRTAGGLWRPPPGCEIAFERFVSDGCSTTYFR